MRMLSCFCFLNQAADSHCPLTLPIPSLKSWTQNRYMIFILKKKPFENNWEGKNAITNVFTRTKCCQLFFLLELKTEISLFLFSFLFLFFFFFFFLLWRREIQKVIKRGSKNWSPFSFSVFPKVIDGNES